MLAGMIRRSAYHGICSAWEALAQESAAVAAASGYDILALRTPLRCLLSLPFNMYVKMLTVLDHLDPSGFLSKHPRLLMLVAIIWMVSCASVAAKRFDCVRRWLKSVWHFGQVVPLVGLHLLVMAFLVGQDALAVFWQADNYFTAAVQTFAALALATVGCTEPKLHVLRVRQALSVLCLSFGSLLAMVSCRVWLDLRKMEAAAGDQDLGFPEARLIAVLLGHTGLLMSVHGTGRLLGYPILSHIASLGSEAVLFTVRFGLLVPGRFLCEAFLRPALSVAVEAAAGLVHQIKRGSVQVARVFQLQILPASRAAAQKVIRDVLVPFGQCLRSCGRGCWALGVACARRLAAVCAATTSVLEVSTVFLYTHCVRPSALLVSYYVAAPAWYCLCWSLYFASLGIECCMRYCGLLLHWLARGVDAAVAWANEQILQPSCDCLCYLAVELPSALYRGAAWTWCCAGFAGGKGVRLLAFAARGLKVCVVDPLMKLVQWLKRNVIEPCWTGLAHCFRLSRELLGALLCSCCRLSSHLASSLHRRYVATLPLLAHARNCVRHGVVRICRQAHARIITPLVSLTCHVASLFWTELLWPTMRAAGAALLTGRRLVSPLGCFVSALCFTKQLWRPREPLGVVSIAAFALAAHSSASIGVLLLGRSLRRIGFGQVGARLELTGSWLFLHLDLALISRLWAIFGHIYGPVSALVLQVVAATMTLLRRGVAALESFLDNTLHAAWRSVRWLWKVILWPALSSMIATLWGSVKLVWLNPFLSMAASAAVVAYMYQVHIGRASSPDVQRFVQVVLWTVRLLMQWSSKFRSLVLIALWRSSSTCSWLALTIWSSAAPAMNLATGEVLELASELSTRPLEMYGRPAFAKVAAVTSLACSRIALMVISRGGLSEQEAIQCTARIGRTSQRLLFIPVLSVAALSQVGSRIALGVAGLLALPFTLIYIGGSVIFLMAEVNQWQLTAVWAQQHRDSRSRAAAVTGHLRSQDMPADITCHLRPLSEALRLYSKDGEECPVCLEPMQMDTNATVQDSLQSQCIRALRCGHAFHQACISEWLQTSRTSRCPLCREHVTTRGQVLQALF
mmetsp:Transcript_11272/g.25862  ORF Transcript_11272/g.25862 Transcript_11272/m.25862 type:complete len:1081 (-) Transcript_11272:225-3467(-)